MANGYIVLIRRPRIFQLSSKHFDMPNGIVFSPDEKHLYVSGTGSFAKVLAFEVVDGKTLKEEPVWVAEVRSDGMCVDEKGHLYTTTEKGIQIFSPDGEEINTIAVPEQPANVCFGGEDFRTLYITARTSLYAVEVNVKGN